MKKVNQDITQRQMNELVRNPFGKFRKKSERDKPVMDEVKIVGFNSVSHMGSYLKDKEDGAFTY